MRPHADARLINLQVSQCKYLLPAQEKQTHRSSCLERLGHLGSTQLPSHPAPLQTSKAKFFYSCICGRGVRVRAGTSAEKGAAVMGCASCHRCFRGHSFFPPHSISHHHSFGPKTRFLSKPQNIEDRVSLGDLFPWQLCSKPGSACEQIPVSHNRTWIQQIVLFFPVCEKTVACNSVSSRAEFNLYITSQFSCKTQKSYYIPNVSKHLLFSSGTCGHARQKWCLNGG